MMRRLPLLVLLGCPTPPDADPPEPTVTPVHTDEEHSDPPDSDPPDTEVVPSNEVEIVLSDAVVCANPTIRDITPLSTIVDGGPDWAAQPFNPDERTLFTGGGITTVDVDNDGRLDILLTGVPGTQLYLQRSPWEFTDVTGTHLPDLADHSVGIVPADLEGDGDIDLFVARYRRADQLWLNDGEGQFSLHPHALDVAGPVTDKSVSGAFADADGDGDLDLMVTVYGAMYGENRRGEPSRLYENTGSGFVDRSDALPEAVQQGYSFNTAWQDLDGDQLPELYVVNDHGQRQPNSLIWNRGDWVFETDDDAVGLDIRLQGMGLSIEDFNGDDVMDFAAAGWANNRLMLSQPPIWADEHLARGFDGVLSRSQAVGWGPHAGDLDNDGDLDLALGFGMIFNQNTAEQQPDELFFADAGIYEARGRQLGADHIGQTRGILLVDLDRDGWLDLARKDLIGPATLQRGACGSSAWLEVDLEQPGANRDAVGADVWVRHGDQQWRRAVRAGGVSVFSAGPMTVHFGLGDIDEVDAVEVRWPDGSRDVVHDVPTRRSLLIRRSTTEGRGP